MTALGFDDKEWQELAQLAALEVECRVLAAETAVEQATADDLEMQIYAKENPDHPNVKALRRYGRAGQAAALALLRRDGGTVEGAAYGWRRDYGEWPTLHNLADRLAGSCGIAGWAAARRVLAAVNDPSDEAGVHVIRAARLREIMGDEPNTCGPTWNPKGEIDLIFYVTAEAQLDCADLYRLAAVA